MDKNLYQSDAARLAAIKQKEEGDRRLLILEVVVGIVSIAILLALIIPAALLQMADGAKIAMISIGIVQFIAVMLFALWLERVAGYYHCKKCNNYYVPSYRNILMSMHICRTRYMRCPKCNKKSWQKKTITKILEEIEK